MADAGELFELGKGPLFWVVVGCVGCCVVIIVVVVTTFCISKEWMRALKWIYGAKESISNRTKGIKNSNKNNDSKEYTSLI